MECEGRSYVRDDRLDPRIGVVVPYFQRDAGLLRRALASISSQTYRPAQVVVVDDGSPRPAALEITPRLRASLPGLTVIRQPNRGVAAARNAGLDALHEGISAVALLDSDDYWMPPHLDNAACALGRGADFFFSNCLHEGESTDYFHTHPRCDLLCQATDADESDIATWSGGISELFGAGCAFATPSVVFRRAIMPELHFSLKFRRAGEDQVAFWDLLTRSGVVMYSTKPTLVVGHEGFGTWRNATFGSVAHLVRLADEIHLRRHVITTHPVSPGDRRLMRQAIAARRADALHSALHLLRRGRKDALKEVLYLLRCDPPCAASWCVHLPKLVYRRLRAAGHTSY